MGSRSLKSLNLPETSFSLARTFRSRARMRLGMLGRAAVSEAATQETKAPPGEPRTRWRAAGTYEALLPTLRLGKL
jgi:hypothetical protein